MTDADPATRRTPTGSVTFASGASCTLAGLGPEPTCSIAFTPATVGPNAITASYSGDATHISSSDSASVTVTVQPPLAEFAFTPSSPTPGQPVAFRDTSTADTGGTVSGWAWDFGDGTQSTARNPQKTFAQAGTYRVRLEVVDSYGGTGATTSDVVVIDDNVTPAVSAAADQSADEGTSAQIDLGSFTDPGADATWTVDVNWGDGTPHTAFLTSATGALGARQHIYADGRATHTVTVTVTDQDGAHDAATFDVTVSNATPTATFDAGNDLTVDESSAAQQHAQLHPQRSRDRHGQVYRDHVWGQRDEGAVLDTHTDSSGSFKCVFEDGPNGSIASIRATDSDGDEGPADEQTFQVANVEPAAELLDDGPKPEGGSVTISFANQTDASHPDERASFHYGFACTPAGSLPDTYAAASTDSTQTCTFHDNGTHPVRGRILDRDGGSATYTTDVVVNNVAPTITSFTGTDALAGPLAFAPSTFTTVFTDPGALDTHSALYEWTDGTVNTKPLVTSPDKIAHAFTSAGCNRAATVTVTDKDGDFDSETASVDVGTGAWLPPLADQPVADKLRNGQVLPVKIRITDCNGVPVIGLQPAITLEKGDRTPINDNVTETIAVSSVSSADTSGVMRAADGHYTYNMRINVPSADLNSPYTIIVSPNGTSNPATLRHKIIATK